VNDAPAAIRLTVNSGAVRGAVMKRTDDGGIYRQNRDRSWSPALPYEAAAFERAAAQRTAR
jgi:hypothetical protein